MNIRAQIYPELEVARDALSQAIADTNPDWPRHPLINSVYFEIHRPLKTCLIEVKRMLAFKGGDEFYRLSLLKLIKRLNTLSNRVLNLTAEFPFVGNIIGSTSNALKNFWQNFASMLPSREKTS